MGMGKGMGYDDTKKISVFSQGVSFWSTLLHLLTHALMFSRKGYLARVEINSDIS